MDVSELIVSILIGAAAIVPVVIGLTKHIVGIFRNKNWGALVSLVLDLMIEAERTYASGANKKDWVLSMVNKSSEFINCKTDLTAIGNMIDNLCLMSNNVNTGKDKATK